jgi:hypothetical protein
MSAEPKCALNLRDFSKALRRKLKAKAAMEDMTLVEFVEKLAREATEDIPDKADASKTKKKRH